MRKLTGLVTAPLTPMHDNGSVNLDAVRLQADRLAAEKASGAFVCGTTGEGLSLTIDERMRLAECWMEGAGGRIPVIVHASHPTFSDCRKLVEHARQIGAFGVACMGPIFFRPRTLEELVAYCGQAAAAAPELPFYFYHIPSLNGLDFSMEKFLRVAAPRIPNLAGVKFTHENLMDFHQCLAVENGRFNILFGRDEILLAACAMGATGAVGSTYNFAGPLARRLLEAFAAGELKAARQCQAQLIRVITILLSYGYLAASKAVMTMQGVPCGPVRPPLGNLSPEQLENLRGELTQIGFL